MPELKPELKPDDKSTDEIPGVNSLKAINPELSLEWSDKNYKMIEFERYSCYCRINKN